MDDFVEKDEFSNRLLILIGEGNCADLAKKTGVSARNIENYVNGPTTPSLKILRKLAYGAGVRVGWLAAGEDPKEYQRPAVEDQQTMDALFLIGREMDKGRSCEDVIAEFTDQARKLYCIPGGKAPTSIVRPLPKASNNQLQEVIEWIEQQDDPTAWGGLLKIRLQADSPEFKEWLKKRASQNSCTGNAMAVSE